MSTRAARRELPALAVDLETELQRIEDMGRLDAATGQEFARLQQSVAELQTLQIGIQVALNNLQFQIDDLSDYFWMHDPRQASFEAMIRHVSEYLESPRFSFSPRTGMGFRL